MIFYKHSLILRGGNEMEKNACKQKRSVNEADIEYYSILELLKKGHFYLGTIALDEYLEKYPKNSRALKEKCAILRQQGQVSEALDLLKNSDQDTNGIIRERAYCYFYQRKYRQALEELKKVKNYHPEVNQVKQLCRCRLGIHARDELFTYSTKQFVNYSPERAIRHIKEHQKSFDGGLEGYFSPSVDVDQLYYDIRSILPQSTQTITGSFMQKYIYYIKDVGYGKDGRILHHLSVNVFPKSNLILGMCPTVCIRNVESNNYQSLLASVKEVTQKNVVKVKTIKRESQIDKFNRRYGGKA